MMHHSLNRTLAVASVALVLCLPMTTGAAQSHGAEPAEGCTGPAAMPSPACARTPTPYFGADGTLWLAWAFGGHVYVSRSADLGATFGEPVAVNRVPEPIATNGENRPKVLTGPANEVYVVWNRPLEARFSGNVRFSRSTDGGRTFAEPLTVNTDQETFGHRFEAMALAPDGRLYVAWLDKRDRDDARKSGAEYNGAALYYTWSEDGGQSFLPDRKIVDHSCECCRVAMAIDRDGLPVILWRHIYNDNIRDHALVKLSAPDRPGEPVRVSYDQWWVDACPHHGPSIAVDDDGVYHAVWFNNGPERHGLFYGRSVDGGRTFPEPTSFGRYDQAAAHPYVLELNGKVLRAWKEFDGKRTRIMHSLSQDGGLSWAAPLPAADTAGQSDHPLLVSNGKAIFLSWHSADEGYRLFPLYEDDVPASHATP